MCAREHVVAASHSPQPTHAQITAAVTTLQLLADPTRLSLMWVLTSAEHDVGTLAAAVAAARPAVSQHLGKLRLAGLVQARRVGRRVLYRADDPHLRTLIGHVLYQADHQTAGTP